MTKQVQRFLEAIEAALAKGDQVLEAWRRFWVNERRRQLAGPGWWFPEVQTSWEQFADAVTECAEAVALVRDLCPPESALPPRSTPGWTPYVDLRYVLEMLPWFVSRIVEDVKSGDISFLEDDMNGHPRQGGFQLIETSVPSEEDPQIGKAWNEALDQLRFARDWYERWLREQRQEAVLRRLQGSGAECQEVDEFDESVQIEDPVAEEQAKPANKSENASPEATCELPPVTESGPKKESHTQRPTRQVDHVVSRILSVYTRKCSDQRLQEIVRILNNPNLTIDGKLWEIDKVLPIPATASSQVLADLLGVSKPAILKTDWWQKNRGRQKERDCAAREERLKEKGKLYDWPGGYDRDDDG
jgi:hypothetical protein